MFQNGAVGIKGACCMFKPPNSYTQVTEVLDGEDEESLRLLKAAAYLARVKPKSFKLVTDTIMESYIGLVCLRGELETPWIVTHRGSSLTLAGEVLNCSICLN